MDVNWPVVFQGLKTILDPIAAASWPIAIAIVAWVFREPITAMVGRIRQVSGFGGTAEFATIEAAKQQQAGEVNESTSLPATAGLVLPRPMRSTTTWTDSCEHSWTKKFTGMTR